jgi:hypothetical protein
MAFWLRENAGSRELRPSSRLILKTVFFDVEVLLEQEMNNKSSRQSKKPISLFIRIKILIIGEKEVMLLSNLPFCHCERGTSEAIANFVWW